MVSDFELKLDQTDHIIEVLKVLFVVDIALSFFQLVSIFNNVCKFVSQSDKTLQNGIE